MVRSVQNLGGIEYSFQSKALKTYEIPVDHFLGPREKMDKDKEAKMQSFIDRKHRWAVQSSIFYSRLATPEPLLGRKAMTYIRRIAWMPSLPSIPRTEGKKGSWRHFFSKYCIIIIRNSEQIFLKCLSYVHELGECFTYTLRNKIYVDFYIGKQSQKVSEKVCHFSLIPHLCKHWTTYRKGNSWPLIG